MLDILSWVIISSFFFASNIDFLLIDVNTYLFIDAGSLLSNSISIFISFLLLSLIGIPFYTSHLVFACFLSLFSIASTFFSLFVIVFWLEIKIKLKK